MSLQPSQHCLEDFFNREQEGQNQNPYRNIQKVYFIPKGQTYNVAAVFVCRISPLYYINSSLILQLHVLFKVDPKQTYIIYLRPLYN